MNTRILTKQIEHWNLKKLSAYLVILGLAVGLVSAWFWYFNIYMSPERRFWSAINTSMATPSATRTLTEGGSGNEVVQKYRFHYAPEKLFENTVSYLERNATTNTTVKTEGIVYYPQDQYLRYTAFDSRQDESTSVNIDSLLGKWAYQPSENEDEDNLNYQSELVTLAIFGNFDAKFRNEILSEMKEKSVYGEINDPLFKVIDGEKVASYDVTIKLKPYVELLGRAFERAGYGQFPPLDPENYQEGSTVPATITIRSKDSTIVGVNFGGRDEIYGNYGVTNTPERPEAEFTVEELQTLVQTTIGQ